MSECVGANYRRASQTNSRVPSPLPLVHIAILFNHLLCCTHILQRNVRTAAAVLLSAKSTSHTQIRAMRTIATLPVAAAPQRISNKSFTAGAAPSFMGQSLRTQNVQASRNVTVMAAKGTFPPFISRTL